MLRSVKASPLVASRTNPPFHHLCGFFVPQLSNSKRFGLNHDPSSKNLSDATVQFTIFGSTRTIDAATGLPFPYHVQRLIDRETAKSLSSSSNKTNVDLSSLKMAPDQYKLWVDERWVTEVKKCVLKGDDKKNTAVPTAESTPTKKSASNKNDKKSKGKSKAKKEESVNNNITTTNVVDNNNSTNGFGNSIAICPWKFSGVCSSSSSSSSSTSSTLRHISNFSPSSEQVQEYDKTFAELVQKHSSSSSNNNNNNSSNSYSTPEVNKAEAPPVKLTTEQLLLNLVKCRSGIPRCGQTGNFFTRQDLAFPLAVACEQRGYKSPFWITSEHPGLTSSLGKNPTEPHLVVKSEEKDKFVLASASLIVFPVKRLALSETALQHALSPEFMKVRGSKDACGMNAVSGVKLSSTGAASSQDAVKFFSQEHPEYEQDGWISFDQVMKLGLPLKCPVGKGGPRSVPVVPDDLFDGGVLVPILSNVKFYNQEQLERPGKLAMKKMPGAPPSLL